MRPHRVGRARASLAQHDQCQRALIPARVRDPDDRRFGHSRHPHDGILERDGADPLASRFDDIFRTVANRDVAAGIDARDVASPEPAVLREPIV